MPLSNINKQAHNTFEIPVITQKIFYRRFIHASLVFIILCFHILYLFRLAEADKEVQEAYKKIALARSKKKSPSKKEKDVAWKALKDREAILKQLESV